MNIVNELNEKTENQLGRLNLLPNENKVTKLKFY